MQGRALQGEAEAHAAVLLVTSTAKALGFLLLDMFMFALSERPCGHQATSASLLREAA